MGMVFRLKNANRVGFGYTRDNVRPPEYAA